MRPSSSAMGRVGGPVTPEECRACRGLPADYPLVAPDYADTRSRLAKQAGLGRKRASDAEARVDIPAAASTLAPEPELAPEQAAPPDEQTTPTPPAKRRGRRKAAAAPALG